MVVIVALAQACTPKHIAVPEPPKPAPATTSRIVLLRDADTDSVGRAIVTNDSGTVELSAERDSTDVTGKAAPSPISTVSESDVTRTFGDALSSLPAPPVRFTLHFRLGSEDLTDESRALVTDVIQAIQRRSTPYVTVVGHTDTTGKDAENFSLGRARGQVVRDLLIRAGLAASSIEVLSLGERDLLIQTPDETPEPRNRRVEIAVR
jgi:outer membrane protein OmpA-like peptidoglycan-associated protein